jgi:hypothetical protein
MIVSAEETPEVSHKTANPNPANKIVLRMGFPSKGLTGGGMETNAALLPCP